MRSPILALSLLLAACGGKITSDATVDDTGTTGTGDGGTGDGGTGDGGTGDGGTGDGGTSGTDADDDGWTVEAGDCNDDDDSVYPGAPDECYDGVDANCDEADDDDCDGDGHYPTELGGEDCDDDDASVYPGASEDRADGADSDCDGAVDEDAYCNVFAPMSNESGSYRTYSTLFFDGISYIESDTLSGYSSAGSVTLNRILDDGAGGGMTIKESWSCDSEGAVQVTGYVINSLGFDLSTVSFSSPSKRALPQADMIEGATWKIDYDSVDTTTGSTQWSIYADVEVLAIDNITTIAGIFATVPVRATYDIVDYSGMFGDRSGVVTWYLAPGVGVVLSEDVLSDGSLAETRELSSYGGFYAMDPSTIIAR